MILNVSPYQLSWMSPGFFRSLKIASSIWIHQFHYLIYVCTHISFVTPILVLSFMSDTVTSEWECWKLYCNRVIVGSYSVIGSSGNCCPSALYPFSMIIREIYITSIVMCCVMQYSHMSIVCHVCSCIRIAESASRLSHHGWWSSSYGPLLLLYPYAYPVAPLFILYIYILYVPSCSHTMSFVLWPMPV